MESIMKHYNIKNIICIFDTCFEECPCQHNVKFYNKYRDVFIVKFSMPDIYKLCIQLKYPIPEHIEKEYIMWSKK